MSNSSGAVAIVFLVTAWRWGFTNRHQYVVGIRSTEEAARELAEAERDDRGGKYGVGVSAWTEGAPRNEPTPQIAYYSSLRGEKGAEECRTTSRNELIGHDVVEAVLDATLWQERAGWLEAVTAPPAPAWLEAVVGRRHADMLASAACHAWCAANPEPERTPESRCALATTVERELTRALEAVARGRQAAVAALGTDLPASHPEALGRADGLPSTREWTPVGSPQSAYLAMGARWMFQRERADETAEVDGLNRTEELGRRGISADDVDSREFARKLVAVLRDSLSVTDLGHIAQAFSDEHAREESRRLQAVAARNA